MEKEDRKKAVALKPTVQVGKNGITESVRKEAIDQLKKNGMVKIKFNVSKSEMLGFSESLSDHATLVMSIGRTLVFKKKGK